MLQPSSFPRFCLVLFISIICNSCVNYFKEYYRKDYLLNHYKPDLITLVEKPALHFTENVEFEEISLMENGLIKMGYSFFEKGNFDVIDQAKTFGKEIGASVILIKENYERTPKEYLDYPSIQSVLPGYLAVNPQGVVLPLYGGPQVAYRYDFNFDTGQASVQRVSIGHAAQVWGTPYYDRNFYAVMDGTDAVLIQNSRQNHEVEVFSYYASFWAKTNYPPALGVEVADIVSEVREQLGIQHGVVAWGVFRDSPAAKAEIHRGDYLISINGSPIVGRLQMGELIRKHIVEKVEIELIQGEERVTKTIQLRKTTF